MYKKKTQRCQARIIEEETTKHAANGKSKPSAVLSNSNEIVNETEVDAFESRSGCPCKKIIFRYETTQSRRKLNSERSETPRTTLETRRNEKRKRRRSEKICFTLKKKAKGPFSETKMKERIRTETFFAADEKKKQISIEKGNESFFEKNKKIFFLRSGKLFKKKILKTRRIIALEAVVRMLENSERKVITINLDNSGIVLMIKRKAVHISFL